MSNAAVLSLLNPEEAKTLVEYVQFRASIQATSKQRTEQKKQFDAQTEKIINLFVQHHIRCIDLSNQGQGPWLTLSKAIKQGTWNFDRYKEFFTLVKTSPQHANMSISDLAEYAPKWLKKYEERGFKLEELKRPPHQQGVQDLVDWKANKDIEQGAGGAAGPAAMAM